MLNKPARQVLANEVAIMVEIERQKAAENLIPGLSFKEFERILLEVKDPRVVYKAIAEKMKGDITLTSDSIDKQRSLYNAVLKLLLDRKVDKLALWTKKEVNNG